VTRKTKGLIVAVGLLGALVTVAVLPRPPGKGAAPPAPDAGRPLPSFALSGGPGAAAGDGLPRAPGEEPIAAAAGGEVLSGRVLDASGGAIPGARIRAELLAGLSDQPVPLGERGTTAALLVARAGPDGGYRATLTRGRHLVAAEADGYAPMRAWVWLAGPVTRDFRLVPAATIAGQVVRKGTRAPVPGARVRAEDGPFSGEAESGPDGTFTLGSLEPGSYRLLAVAPPLAGRLATPVTARLATRAEGVVIEVDQARSIAGRVRRPDGPPVAGARVELRRGGQARGRAVTDSRGDFRLEGLLPDHYGVGASAPGLARASRVVTLAEQDLNGVDLVLDAAAELRGQVLDAEGRAAAGVAVNLEVDDKVLPPARADAEGRFSFTELGPGPAVIQADGEERGRARQELGPLAPGQRREVTLRLSAGGLSVRGQIRWKNGQPAAGIEVQAINLRSDWDGDEVSTGPDGRYRVGPFPRGAVVAVTARPPSATPLVPASGKRTVRLETGDAGGIDFVFSPAAGEIRGVVAGPGGGPLAGAVVRAEGTRVVSGEDGAFVLDGLAPGEHDLRADYPGLPGAAARQVAAGRTDVRIAFRRGAVLAGVVDGISPRGAGLCSVWARPRAAGEAEGPEDRAVCGEGAAFELRGLAPGEYDLVAITLDGRSGGLPRVTLSEGQERRDLRVRLAGGVTLVGRIVDLESRAPVAGAQVAAEVEGTTIRATSDAAGRFRLEGVRRGLTAYLRFEAPGHLGNGLQRSAPMEGETYDLGAVPLLRERPGPPPTGRAGIVLAVNADGAFEVKDTVEDLPASKAGVRPGELVARIDGHDLENADLGMAVALIRGKSGTPLVLELRRPRAPPRQVRLVRD
jgi:hypothetical protein